MQTYLYLYLYESTCTCACTCICTEMLVLIKSYILYFPVSHVREKFDKIAINSLFLIRDIEEERAGPFIQLMGIAEFLLVKDTLYVIN